MTTDPLNGRAITEIDWDAGDALSFPLCVSSVSDAEHGARQIWGVSAAWGNIVLADQGRSIGTSSDPLAGQPEPIGVVPPAGQGAVPAGARQRPAYLRCPRTGRQPAGLGCRRPAGHAGRGRLAHRR